jgi:hypothetical protein
MLRFRVKKVAAAAANKGISLFLFINIPYFILLKIKK